MYNPNSLLRESVMGGELHRHWVFFTGTGLASYRQIGPRLAPPLTTFEPTGNLDDTKGGKGTPAVPSATIGPLPGEGSSKPPRQRAYFRVSPGFACLGRGLAPDPSPTAPNAILLLSGRPSSWGLRPLR